MVFGVLNCVFGGLGILCTPFSILGIFMGDLVPMNGNQMQIVAGYKAFLLVTSILGIVIAAWLLSLGIGLLKFKSWARYGSIIYAWVMIAWGILGIGINMLALSRGWITLPQEAMPSYLIGGMVGFIYPVLLLIFMQTEKVKRAFAAIETAESMEV